MTPARSPYVTVGVAGRPHGLRGEFRVNAHGGLPQGLKGYSKVYLDRGRGVEPVELISSRMHGKFILLKLEGIDSPEAAGGLIGAEICVERSEMPALEEGEYYHVDLIGCSIEDENANNLGSVIDVFSTGAHDVLTVRDKGSEWMLPVVSDFVDEIDVDKRIVKVKKIEGLRI